jgi:hypothetical protein
MPLPRQGMPLLQQGSPSSRPWPVRWLICISAARLICISPARPWGLVPGGLAVVRQHLALNALKRLD